MEEENVRSFCFCLLTNKHYDFVREPIRFHAKMWRNEPNQSTQLNEFESGLEVLLILFCFLFFCSVSIVGYALCGWHEWCDAP